MIKFLFILLSLFCLSGCKDIGEKFEENFESTQDAINDILTGNDEDVTAPKTCYSSGMSPTEEGMEYIYSKAAFCSENENATEFADTNKLHADMVKALGIADNARARYLFEEASKKFNFTTEDNKEIYATYLDAIMMGNNEQYPANIGVQEGFLSAHNGVTSLAVDTLMFYTRRREVVILDENSISPNLGGAVLVDSIHEILPEEDRHQLSGSLYETIVDDVKYKELTGWLTNAIRAFVVDMTINENEDLKCYVIQTTDGTTRIVRYEGGNYPTVGDYIRWGIDNG